MGSSISSFHSYSTVVEVQSGSEDSGPCCNGILGKHTKPRELKISLEVWGMGDFLDLVNYLVSQNSPKVELLRYTDCLHEQWILPDVQDLGLRLDNKLRVFLILLYLVPTILDGVFGHTIIMIYVTMISGDSRSLESVSYVAFEL